MNPRVINADCLDALRDLPDASVSAVVTDPPYGLSNTDPAHVVETLTRWATGDREYVPAGKGFMGKSWDSFVPPPAVWDGCLRVLKPGGHLLAFAGSRTFDLMTLSIRFAGFDVRDSIAWLYGSGFPKSLDVSKAIDKARTEDKAPTRVVCRAIRAAMNADGLRPRDLVQHFDGCHPRLIDHWAARDTDSQPALPTPGQWATLRRVLPALDGELDAEVARLNARKGTPGAAWEGREVTGEVEEWADRTNYALTSRDGLRRDQAHEGSDAERWQGWGTALKPAFEPIVVARKPLSGMTVAANALAHGTGALNIDGCRVESTDGQLAAKYASVQNAGARENSVYGTDARDRAGAAPHAGGRWPANVVLDEDAAAELDEQSGWQRDGVAVNRNRNGQRHDSHVPIAPTRVQSEDVGYGGGGGASRFFYVAKAPTRERPSYVREDGTRVAHPTVKPVTLMRWLVRLVTPPGGTVLDPFAGSGATVEAAMLEGFDVIAIEREAEYLPLIDQRIARAEDASRTPPTSPDLFDLLGGAA